MQSEDEEVIEDSDSSEEDHPVRMLTKQTTKKGKSTRKDTVDSLGSNIPLQKLAKLLEYGVLAQASEDSKHTYKVAELAGESA